MIILVDGELRIVRVAREVGWNRQSVQLWLTWRNNFKQWKRNVKRIRLTTTMRNLWEEISENSFKGNITKTVWKIFGNADPGWLRLFDPGSARKRDIYWFWRGMDILYSTSNSNQWSSQNTEHWNWVRCKLAKNKKLYFLRTKIASS